MPSSWLLLTLTLMGSQGVPWPSIGLSRIFSIMCSMICCPRMVHCWLWLRFMGLSLGGSTSFSSSCFRSVVATFDQTASLRVCNCCVSLGDPRRSEPELELDEDPSELLLLRLSVLDNSMRASQAVAASGETPATGLGLGGVALGPAAWLLALEAKYLFLNGLGALGCWETEVWSWSAMLGSDPGRLEVVNSLPWPQATPLDKDGV